MIQYGREVGVAGRSPEMFKLAPRIKQTDLPICVSV